MDSKKVFQDFVTAVRKHLKRDLNVSLSGIGTLNVISVPSRSESLGPDKFALHPPAQNILLESDLSATTDESFVTEFASTLEISPEDAEAVIAVLTKEMMDQMPVTIKGLGTFARSQGGFSFSADEPLIQFIFDRSLDITSIEVKNTPTASIPSKRSSPSRRGAAWPIIAIPIVIVLIIGGYFLIPRIMDFASPTTENPVSAGMDADMTDAPPNEPDPSQSEGSDEVTSATNPTESDVDLPESDPITAESPEISSSDADPTAAATPANVSTPNREFPILDRQLGGYTLVIGSFRASSRALTVVKQYRSIYPVIPVDTLIGSNDRYRVTIGQVSTIPEAVFLKENLSQIPSDSWVMNILDF